MRDNIIQTFLPIIVILVLNVAAALIVKKINPPTMIKLVITIVILVGSVIILSLLLNIYVPGQEPVTKTTEPEPPPTTQVSPEPQRPPPAIPPSPTPTSSPSPPASPLPPTLVWEKFYGGLYYDMAYSIQQTADGGYIIAGESDSYSKSGDPDVYLVKTDSEGNEQWSKTFGLLCGRWALRRS